MEKRRRIGATFSLFICLLQVTECTKKKPCRLFGLFVTGFLSEIGWMVTEGVHWVAGAALTSVSSALELALALQ